MVDLTGDSESEVSLSIRVGLLSGEGWAGLYLFNRRRTLGVIETPSGTLRLFVATSGAVDTIGSTDLPLPLLLARDGEGFALPCSGVLGVVE